MRALLALSAIALTAACSGLEQPLETSPPRASATTLEPTARSAPPPAAPPAAPRAEPEVEPGRARRTTRDFVVDYPAALAADADAVVAATTAAIRALEAWSEVSFADVLDGGALTVRVAVPEERRVGPGGVEVRSAFRGAALAAAVDVLAPSAYPAGVGTLLGEPLDERHLRRRLTHGAGALFARRLRRIAGGWDLDAAPPWFVHGVSEWLALTLHEGADAAFERLLRATAEPAADDAGALRVRSELVDGALTLRFLAERRGATSVRTLLLDSGATFGAGLRRVYGLDEADLPLALAAWRAQRLDAR